jgi:hypothetical protein
MAVAMSFAISLVTTTARLGFTSNLLSAWLTGATLQKRGDGGSTRSTDPNHQAREAD